MNTVIENPSAPRSRPVVAALPRRMRAVQWLRRTHGWFGLWGATLGLLFGFSGIWLNHRNILKLPPVTQLRTNSQIALPDPAPADAAALAVWLQTALKLPGPAISVKVDAARPVAWAEKPGKGESEGKREEPRTPPLMQPEHWTITFAGAQHSVQADAWVGNRSVSVRTTDSGPLATLQNLHKGTGMTLPWILLVDTLAGSLILLSLSGLALWTLTHRKRAVGVAIFGTALAVTAGLVVGGL